MDLSLKDASLLGLEDVLRNIKVVSPYGSQAKREMKPFGPAERNALQAELDLLERFVLAMKRQPDFFSQLRSRLSHLKEIGESLESACQGVALSQVSLYDIKGVLLMMKGITKQYASFIALLPQELQLRLPEASDRALDPRGEGIESFYISDEYSETLAAVRGRLKEQEEALKHCRRSRAGAVQADYGQLRFRPNGVAVVAKSDRALYEQLRADERLMVVDEHYETVSFGVTADDAMAQLQREIEALKWEEEQETYAVRLRLSQIICGDIEDFRWSLSALGGLDLYVAKAALAIGVNGVKPELAAAGTGIWIEAGRHIGVEQRLRREHQAYTPVTVRFDTPVALITGANMGGKTIALKMIGLCVAMAHYGLYVPAKAFATPVLSYLVAVIGDEQSIDRGLSTFGSEVISLIHALDQADREGLILVDELARGTNPMEGAALSKSIVAYLSTQRAYSVITTHFDGIAPPGDCAVRHWQVKGLRPDATWSQEGTLDKAHLSAQMDYTLTLVDPDKGVPHEALRIAALMGLPQHIVNKAITYLQHEEAQRAEQTQPESKHHR